MANVLVVIELREGRALPVCLEALGQARRLSTALGGTLYAVVPLKHAPRYGEGDVIEVLAQHGADKVVLVTDEALTHDGGMRWGTYGPAIAQVSDQLPPMLLLFGETAGAREVAPRAAARMGAAYLSDAWIEVREGRLHLWEGSGASAHALDGELEYPVVATLPPGRYTTASGDDEAEVEVLAAPGRAGDFDELGWEIDPRPATLVVAPPEKPSFDEAWGAHPEPDAVREAAQALADALTAKLSSSATPVSARLVIAVGAPLDAPAADVRVAVGADAAEAPAHYALVGEPAAAARALADALENDGAKPALSEGKS
ncbi:MAG TPA: hypothetical protein VFF06_12015 [Polyangia bacterium]|nr:hypothetical protein [Polyangia bacterium]